MNCVDDKSYRYGFSTVKTQNIVDEYTSRRQFGGKGKVPLLLFASDEQIIHELNDRRSEGETVNLNLEAEAERLKITL